MKITRLEKILLALALCGCLTATGAANAEDESETTGTTHTIYEATKKDSSGNELYTVTVTVTADDSKTETHTFTDVNGKSYTYYTNPTVSSPTVTITSPDGSTFSNLSDLSLTYDSPNAVDENNNPVSTTEKYYAWVWTSDTDETGAELTTGNYVFTDVTEAVSSDPTTTVNVTVSYVPSESQGIYNDGTDTSLNGSNITADFVGDDHEYSEEGSTHFGGAIFNYANSGKSASLGTITGNFIGNHVGSLEDTDEREDTNEYGGAIANHTDLQSGSSATIDAIYGNFIGNYVESTFGRALGGAILNSEGASIGSITGDFLGNYTVTNASEAHGGAMKNYGTIGTITGNFIGNYTIAEGIDAYGGAIYNEGTGSITSIKGDFIGNYTTSKGNVTDDGDDDDDDEEGVGNGGAGGAIYNRGDIGKIDDDDPVTGGIEGNFIANSVETLLGSSQGGAIFNAYVGTISSITGDFIGNSSKSTLTSSDSVHSGGGAIANEGTIGDITGDFIGNVAETDSSSGDVYSCGGAIYNNKITAKIGNITGNFIGNSAETNRSHARGGAIYNADYGKIGNITGNFIGNYAESKGTITNAWAYGGAICNYSSTCTIGTIGTSSSKSSFIGNYAKTSGNYAYGGAIYNAGTFSDIYADFIGNYAESTSTSTWGTYNPTAFGGAICNNGGTMGAIAGNFISNYATSAGSLAYGGAIYNVVGSSSTGGTIKSITGDFVGNYATTTGTEASAVAWGGAIYNTGKISGSTTAAAISGNFIENKAESSANDSYGGAIYNNGTIGTLDENNSVKVDGISNSTFQGNTANRGGAIYNGTDKSTAESDGGIQDGVYTGIIASITGSQFIGNKATAYGGAIYNYADGAIYSIAENYFGENEAEDGNGGAIENAEANSYIGTITGNTFYKNEVTKSDHGGGAIYSEGIIGSLANNQFIENKSGNFGGAIYNNGGSIAGGGGSIEENYFYKNESNRGGAIYNTVTRSVVSDADLNELGVTETFDLAGLTSAEGSGSIFSITGNTFMYNKANNFGGAIYNYHGGDIGAISDNLFYGNEADGGNGGAVENAEFDTSIGTMDNNVFAYNKSANNGGAIYNQGTIGIDKDTGEATTDGAITNSTFVGNEAKSGGAIYNNYGTSTVYFYDEDSTTSSIDGAVKVDDASTNSDGNTLYSVEEAGAGAIGNITNCYFEGNKATDGSGGAIYNASGTVTDETTGATTYYTTTMGTITNTSFVNNSATDKGGAIYSATDLTIAADGSQENGDVVFSGNKATNGGDAIYMATHYDESGNSVASKLSFSLTGGGKIYLYDNIQGDSGYSVDISGDGLNNIFYLLNDVKDANLSVGAALISPDSIKPLDESAGGDSGDDSETETVNGNLTLSTLNGEAHVYNVSSFTVAGDFNMEADVDLKNEKMDHFETTDGNDGEGTLDAGDGVTNGHSGTLNVSALNIYSDTTKNSVAVYFAEEGLMSNVTSSVSSALGPIYEYDLTYLYKDEEGNVYDQSGEIYEGEDFDTSLLESKDSGGYFVYNNSGRNNPAVVAPAVAQMGTLGAFNMMLDYNFEHSDYYMKLPEDLRLAKIEEAKTKKARRRIAESDPTKPAYYNRNELTYRGAWFRSFAANESVSYRGRYTSRDKYWGGLVGFDTDMREHENGWATVFTGFVGTTGIRQEYSGGHIKQHGGMIGATANFYKKNFYTAWTVAAGSMKAHEHTMYGHDKDRIDDYGIAARFGWNIDMDYNGKFAILPTFTASYSYIHPEDFTNSADVKITGSGMRAVQLNPNVKLIWKMNDGWQPYLTVGEIWTVGQSLHMRTDGQKLLDELELRAYTEYGIGVQKRWANERDAYIQLLGHSDGRDGILVNAGIRWNF